MVIEKGDEFLSVVWHEQRDSVGVLTDNFVGEFFEIAVKIL